jgi:DNA-binding CsgD family transcriptional regulator
MTLSVIREAFFRGEFEACLGLCDAFRPRDAKDAVEIALLRARCLIPLGRSEHAIEVLRAARLRDDQHDEYLTGRVLLSAAYVNLGQYDRGLDLAREAYEKLDEAHPTVRAEVTANLGMAHFWKGEYARAGRVLEGVPADADIVYAQALVYRGYVAWASSDYAGSVDKFRDALSTLDVCEHRDRFIEARCIFGLTYLCGELPRLDLWPEVAERIQRFDWTVSGVVTWRYWVAVEASFIAEVLGEMADSTRWAKLAEQLAPDDSARIAAWCRLAARFGRYDEPSAHAYFVDKAREMYEAMPSDVRRSAEQRSLPLAIADETVYGATPMAAAPLLTYYAEAILPTMRGHAQERVLEASHAMILGHFEERRGNRARAEEAYLRSFERFGSLGFLRRAAIVAYRLFVMTGDQQYEAFITDVLRDASPAYWVKARMTKSRTEARLSKRHLDILPLVAQGLKNKEIAAVRGGSPWTARNTVREAITLLGVRNRAELASVAAQLGLLQPAK